MGKPVPRHPPRSRRIFTRPTVCGRQSNGNQPTDPDKGNRRRRGRPIPARLSRNKQLADGACGGGAVGGSARVAPAGPNGRPFPAGRLRAAELGSLSGRPPPPPASAASRQGHPGPGGEQTGVTGGTPAHALSVVTGTAAHGRDGAWRTGARRGAEVEAVAGSSALWTAVPHTARRLIDRGRAPDSPRLAGTAAPELQGAY